MALVKSELKSREILSKTLSPVNFFLYLVVLQGKMNKTITQKITEIFPDTRLKEPLSKHCTIRIGGPADAFVELKDLKPKTIENLKTLLKFLKKNKIPYLLMGGGSNILFHDKGFRGTIIKLTAKDLTFTKTTLTADAGAILQVIIAKAKTKGFHNLSQFTGIPGTLGGAVRGNAGANGLEIKDILKQVLLLNPKTGRTRTVKPKDLKFKYRYSKLKKTNDIVLQATLKLSKAAKHKTLSTQLNAKRSQSQPYGLSAGSFFKNPDPSPDKPHLKAGYLIDQCGLKGKRQGNAQISPKHANFIQNAGTLAKPATQKDILKLADLAKKEVYKKFKIRLEEEVQIIPERL
jgi:UDP-N-acetylmuramate dehydrogenase